MANTSNIFEMKFGRPQTVLLDKEMPNGVIVELGDTLEGTKGREYDHCHGVVAEKEMTSVIGKFIIVAPEINVQQYRTIDGQIGKFVLEANETYSAYMLNKYDRIEYSDAYIKDATGVQVGDKLKVTAPVAGTGERFAKDDAKGCLRVVSIVDLWLPIMLQPNTKAGQGSNKTASLMPASCKMYKVEVEK